MTTVDIPRMIRLVTRDKIHVMRSVPTPLRSPNEAHDLAQKIVQEPSTINDKVLGINIIPNRKYTRWHWSLAIFYSPFPRYRLFFRASLRALSSLADYHFGSKNLLSSVDYFSGSYFELLSLPVPLQ